VTRIQRMKDNITNIETAKSSTKFRGDWLQYLYTNDCPNSKREIPQRLYSVTPNSVLHQVISLTLTIY